MLVVAYLIDENFGNRIIALLAPITGDNNAGLVFLIALLFVAMAGWMFTLKLFDKVFGTRHFQL